ncbi:MAG TPA: phosphatase PAP2 family protein [Conexibacter sp.]|nr:phosphatase PAP2 family protein [Conexibacter sp.]
MWAGGSVAVVVAFGLPYTRDWVFAWAVLGALAVSFGDLGGWFRGVLVDWLPFFLVMTAYDLARGGADGWLAPTHYLPQADADRWLFGGDVPSAWLQQQLHVTGRVQWFEVLAFLVYVSHFFVTPLLAAALWVRDRWRFRRFAASLALLTLMGCVTFVAFPAAPPWLASEHGLVAPTARLIPQLWTWLGIGAADSFVDAGYRYANEVAAVPSLHAAVSLLVALSVWPRRTWARALVAAYPLAMAFAVVYTGEHYVTDVLLGWIYAVAAFAAVRWVAARLASRRLVAARATDR